MTVTSMLHNGYRPDGRGCLTRLVCCPADRDNAQAANQHVERLVRSGTGQLLRVETANKRGKK